MKTRVPILFLPLLLVAAPAALGQQVSPPGDFSSPEQMLPPGEELLLKPEPKDPEQSRTEVLADLFDRLKKAPNPESAEIVADAIEKIWMKSGSDTVDLLMARAIRMAREENFDLALDILDSVVEIAPEFSEGWNQRATIYFMRRDFRRSLEDLRHVLAIEPRHYKAISGLGLIMRELGDNEAALKAIREALQLYPQSTDSIQMEKELSREVEGQGI